MISVRKINAIYAKQIRNITKNYFVLSGAVMGPFMAYVINLVDGTHPVPAVVMGVLMGMLMGGSHTMCCLIAEEKEKNTLNVLMTSTVSSLDFLIGNGLITLTLTMIGNMIVYFMISGHNIGLLSFLMVSGLGSIAAIVLGGIFGILSKNQMTASTLMSPVIITLMYIPLFFDMYSFIRQNVLNYLFTEHVTVALVLYDGYGLRLGNIVTIFLNIIVLSLIFMLIYKKKGFGN